MYAKCGRYEAIEIDGRWYVFDHKHPETAPAGCRDEREARLNVRVWNLLAAPELL